MKQLFLHNWKAKLLSLVAATAVWMLIKSGIPRQPEREQFNFGRTAPELSP